MVLKSLLTKSLNEFPGEVDSLVMHNTLSSTVYQIIADYKVHC